MGEQEMTEITLSKYCEDVLHQLQACGVPRTSWDGIMQFITTGRPMGSFLVAVFSNDLMLTVTKADDLNRHSLRDYVHFLQACAPAACHGSLQAVTDWEKAGGLVGLTQQIKVVVPDRPVE
jgi:hypothetical protein